MAVAWLLSGLLGFALGVAAGVRSGRPLDRAICWWAYTLASAPTFWVGLLLPYVFSVSLGWTPVCCAVPVGALADEVTLLDRLHHLVLPALTLSIVGVAPVVLHTRNAVVETLASDHVTFARAQGESTAGVVVHRLLRHAAAPAVLLQFAALGELFGGAVLAEQVFAALDPELVAPSWLDRRPHELSGGQLQRVALARGLLARPRFLVADEITSGLDAVTQVRVWHLLLERCRSAGIGVLAISHDRPLLEAVADRVVDWPPPSEDTEPGLRRPLEVAQAGKAAR